MKIIIALFAFSLLISGCICCGGSEIEDGSEVKYSDTLKVPDQTAPSTTSTSFTSTSSTKAPSTTSTLIEREDEVETKDCLKLKLSEILGCYIDSAKKEKDPSICERLNSFNDQVICKAVVSRDESICKSVRGDPSKKDKCYKKLAIEKGDSDLCKLIRSPNTGRECHKTFD